MSAANNGGPAFPCIEMTVTGIDSDGMERMENEACGGISARDYFAAKALPWFAEAVSDDPIKGLTWQQVAARGAYELADAMLAARSEA